MQFLFEHIQPTEANVVLTEGADGKTMWINGICMQGAIKNRNGRIYPVNEIATAVEKAQVLIRENNGIFGELEHPETLRINADRISHAITEMYMVGDNAYGKAKLLNTPMGLIAQELLKSKVRIGVSSRGTGDVMESGEVKSFMFSTYDIVLTPSARDAIAMPVYESIMQANNGGRIQTLAESLRDDPAAQRYLTAEVMKFIATLK